ncbi:unnamed protein product [Lactuca virosa]|uniref:Uncharacterized protein n=1 Tax=Lactuca virosa TaxID=75947 RepID=A0AAU9MDP3_9ASTR|nr:unnamed protein product [Lactuca virosa]
MKLDTGDVALCRRGGTPPAGCRWRGRDPPVGCRWKALDGEAGLDGGQKWEASALRETSEVGEAVDVENLEEEKGFCRSEKERKGN